MRLRTDSLHTAGWLRAHALRGCHCAPEMIAAAQVPRRERKSGSVSHIAHDPEYANVEPAQPGDVWRVQGGYALTCPRPECEQGVHTWWHAWDCPAGKAPAGPCKYGRNSCWVWTGTPEEGNLSASPSLWVQAERGGCGYHGFLVNGVLSDG